jgi:hypothetical protein
MRIKTLAFAMLLGASMLSQQEVQATTLGVCRTSCENGSPCCFVSTTWSCNVYCNNICEYEDTSPTLGGQCDTYVEPLGWMQGEVCDCYGG